MRRITPVVMSLMAFMLVVTTIPLPATAAQVDGELSWTLPCDALGSGSMGGSPSAPDSLSDLLGFSRSELRADSMLQITLELDSAETATLSATLTVGEQVVELSGKGSYGPYQQSPLYTGEFAATTSTGVDCQFFLQVYPGGNQQQATIFFEEENMPLRFGQPAGNIQAINEQIHERLRSLVQMPAGYQLDQLPLNFEPAPLIKENQVLVPVRSLLTALGARVSWEGSSQTIKVKKDELSLSLSLPNQTMQLDGQEPRAMFIHREPSGQTFAPLEPVAQALGATVFIRRDGIVNIISRERTLEASEGTLQFIFVTSQNVIIQNQTARPYDLGNWSLVCTDYQVVNRPMVEFRFPQEFVLQPGEQVQVAGELVTEPDNQLLFDWNEVAETTGTQANMQLIITSLQPGQERLLLQSPGGDRYIGNWRFVSAAGKPAFDLTAAWLMQGSSYSVSGRPGEATNPLELRWPNLPSVEEAYRAEQAARAEHEKELRAKLVETYTPLTAALGLTDSDYEFYTASDADRLLLESKLDRFDGNREASRALLYSKMGLVEPLAAVGDFVPVYYLSPDAQEAYVGLIKKDGTLVAFRFSQVLDGGFYTWAHEQVLP